MDLSIFLAKLFGLYFLIAGGIIMMRQKSYMHIIMNVVGQRELLALIGLGQLFAGLGLVIAHPVFTADWRGVITIIGLWITIEGAFYLAAPYTKVMKFMRAFNTPAWYTSGGMLAVVLGGYLAGIGFGLW